MSNAQPKFEIGDEVVIKHEVKGIPVDIPALIVNHRPAYGTWDYKLELIDDGEKTSDWVRESNLEQYDK